LGGHTSVYEYDRDNIFISAKGTVATVGLWQLNRRL
jgi:hypothetical protein